jgi:hypothetical protein
VALMNDRGKSRCNTCQTTASVAELVYASEQKAPGRLSSDMKDHRKGLTVRCQITPHPPQGGYGRPSNITRDYALHKVCCARWAWQLRRCAPAHLNTKWSGARTPAPPGPFRLPARPRVSARAAAAGANSAPSFASPSHRHPSMNVGFAGKRLPEHADRVAPCSNCQGYINGAKGAPPLTSLGFGFLRRSTSCIHAVVRAMLRGKHVQ